MTALDVAWLIYQWGVHAALFGVVLAVTGGVSIYVTTRPKPGPVSDEELLDVAYTAGVVKVGDER